VYYQDEPVADPSAMGLYYVSELAGKYITVILSGEGADETFGGYPIYHEPKSLRVFSYLPKRLRERLSDVADWLPSGMKGRSFLERGSLPLERRFVGNAFIFNEDAKRELLRGINESGMALTPFDITGVYYGETAHLDDITRMQYVDLHTNPPSVSLDVPAQHQLPELLNGCEVTSLSMLLTAVGHPIDKLTLAKEEPVDPTPIVYGPDQSISFWGDPNKGFVGKEGGSPGYGIYHGPIVALINQILPGKAVDLTGHSFTDLLGVVAHQRPVMVWTTADFQPTSDWVTWNSPDGPIHATFSESRCPLSRL
jgi:uncharacterized protein YvpB